MTNQEMTLLRQATGAAVLRMKRAEEEIARLRAAVVQALADLPYADDCHETYLILTQALEGK